MSYTPNTWATGDTITAEKLNNMEQGIAGAGGAFIVNMDAQNTLDKTWQEIYNAATGGQVVMVIVQGTEGSAVLCNIIPVLMVVGGPLAGGGEMYVVSGIEIALSSSQVNKVIFVTTSANGYPVKDS